MCRDLVHLASQLSSPRLQDCAAVYSFTLPSTDISLVSKCVAFTNGVARNPLVNVSGNKHVGISQRGRKLSLIHVY